MDVRGVLRPVGPLPPRVYWMRRLLPLAAIAVLVAVIAVSCAGGSSDGRTAGNSGDAVVVPTASPTPTPTASTLTSPTPTATSTASATASPSASTPPCHAADLQVSASTDARTYPKGATPVLRVTIRNAGSGTCVLTQTPSRRNWTIRSGNDLIWSTTDCVTSKAAIETPLPPDKSVTRTLGWDRHRMGPHCTEMSTVARPGTYQLFVVVDGVHSGPAVFTLTG